MPVEPLAGKRYVNITEKRTRIERAKFVKYLLDKCYLEVTRIVLVLDNLNTHGIASLYEAFPAPEALRLAQRHEIHYTPKHGGWLNMAEIELSALKTQCLERRIPNMEAMKYEVNAWENDRNNKIALIDWQFTTADARVKLERLYPSF
jgi:hypothetical protein